MYANRSSRMVGPSTKGAEFAESRTAAPCESASMTRITGLRVWVCPTSPARIRLQLVWYLLSVILRAGIGSVLYKQLDDLRVLVVHSDM